MKKGRDGEKMENYGENSGQLMSLPVDPLRGTDWNADRIVLHYHQGHVLPNRELFSGAYPAK